MNEITRIHLGGVAYEIDVSAKKDLEKYLTAIKKSLGEDSDAMEDIEIRMTEILAERGVTKDSVITEYDLKAIKERLGEPKDFSSDGTESANEETIAEKVNKVFSEKRFYRDPDNAVLGGVVAGLSAYTGWDVTLLRLLLVILVFMSFGFFVLAYIVIWIVAPVARTTSEKLSMHGKPVNIDSIKASAKDIGKKAKSSAKDIRDKTKTASQDVADKATKASKTMAEEVRSATDHVVDKSASAGYAIGRILSIFCGLIGIIAAFGCLIGLAAATVWGVGMLLNFNLPTAPLLIATGITAFFSMLFLIIFTIALSVSLITGSFGNRRKKPGITALLIITIILFTSSLTTGTVWACLTSTNDIKGTVDIVREHSNDWVFVRHF